MSIDYNVVTTENYINDQEDAAEFACNSTAVENGHMVEEAENCDDGNLNCPDCPFTPEGREKRKEKVIKYQEIKEEDKEEIYEDDYDYMGKTGRCRYCKNLIREWYLHNKFCGLELK
jgi:hypothetical protein